MLMPCNISESLKLAENRSNLVLLFNFESKRFLYTNYMIFIVQKI